MEKIEKRKQHLGGVLGQKNVVIGNAITQAGQGLNLTEKRILFAAIAKMGGKIDASGFITLSAREYASTYGVPLNLAYTQLKNASEGFFNRYIALRVEDAHGFLISRLRWLDAYQYHDKNGFVSISFSKHIVPYLIDLDKKFTQYKLNQACALRSVYSWRLLELIKQQSNGWLHISIDDLHHALDVPESVRANFGKLRSKIIEPAIKELAEKDNWDIGFLPMKESRKVVAVRFEFARNQGVSEKRGIVHTK